MCTLGMSAEFRRHGIAVNALWPRICVWTAAVAMLKREDATAKSRCRRPEVMSDAAYLMLQQPATQFNGNFMTDERVMQKSGVADMGVYAYDPGKRLVFVFLVNYCRISEAKHLMDDLFIPGLEYEGPGDWGISTFDSAPREQAKL